jgi:hypothetical protein
MSLESPPGTVQFLITSRKGLEQFLLLACLLLDRGILPTSALSVWQVMEAYR